MKDHEPPRQLRARIAIALGYFTGITLIVGWSLPDGAVPYRRVQPAMSLPDSGASRATTESAHLMPAKGATRSKANCAGCGVVESGRTIDTRDEPAGGCSAGESGTSDISNVFAASGSGVESLAEIVSATIAGEGGTRKIATTTRHQIVVRFPDGTRVAFDEATPRTLRVGDRIKVIAGAVEAR